MRHGLAQRGGVIARTGTLLCVAALVLAATHACAAELEPRAYVNTPVGLNFLIAGYSYSEGGLSTNASSPIKDAQLRIHTELLAYARTLDVWGKSGKFDVILPYSQLSGTAMLDGQPQERQVSGLNDPRFRFSVNFYGAPALSMQEFASYRQDLLIGASIQVSAPVGQYDSSKVVNIGTNRWSDQTRHRNQQGVRSAHAGTYRRGDYFYQERRLRWRQYPRAGSRVLHAGTHHLRLWPRSMGCIGRDLRLRRAYDGQRGARR